MIFNFATPSNCPTCLVDLSPACALCQSNHRASVFSSSPCDSAWANNQLHKHWIGKWQIPFLQFHLEYILPMYDLLIISFTLFLQILACCRTPRYPIARYPSYRTHYGWYKFPRLSETTDAEKGIKGEHEKRPTVSQAVFHPPWPSSTGIHK